MACNNICTTIDSQKWRMLDFLEDFRFLRCSKFWIDSILYSVESQLIRTYMKDSSDSNNSMNCYYNIKLEEFSRLSKIRNSTDLKESNKFGELDDEILLMELIHFAFFICEISLPSFILANRPKSLAKFENDSEQQASTPGSRNSFPNEDLQQQCDSTAKIIEDFQIWATSIFAKVLKIIEFTNNAREKFFGAFRDCIDSLDVSNSSTIANQSHNHRFDPLYDSQQFVIYDKEESLLHLKCSSKVKEKGSSLSLSGVITITNIRLVFNGIINERFNKVETSILFTEILNHKQKKTSGKANLWILTANFVNYDLHISGSHREITKFSHLFIKNLNNARLLNINAENRQLWSRYIYLPTISKSALKKSPFIAIENSKKHLNIPNYPNEIYVPKSLSSSECLRKIMKLFNNKALPILLSTNIYSNSSFFRSGELNGILDPNNLSLNEIINFFALLANEEIPKIQQLSEEPKGILKIKRLTRAFSVNSNRNKLNSSHQYISYSSVSSSFDLNEEPKALVICSVKNAQTLRNLAKQFSIGFINFEDSANLLPSIKFYHSTQFFLNFNQLSSSILRTVNFLVYSNHLKSLNILTMLKASSHSTNIINSLLDLCLNAKYRTIQGFVQLVFHNWLVFENKATKVAEIGDFRTRLSISFIQFLFCVFQISISYPKLFEFNSHLIDIFAFHHLSDFFADFCLGESITNYSIMNYLISPTNSHDNSPNKFYQLFVNNSYESCSESNQEAIIIPCVDRHSFRPWPHFLHPLNSFQPTPLQLLKVATKTTTTTIDNSYSSSLDLSQFSNLIVAQPMAIEQVNSEEDVKDYNAFLQLSIPLSSHFKLKSFSSGSNHIFENIEIDYFQFNSCSVCLEPVVCKLDDGLSCSMCTMIIHLRCNDERFMEDLRYCSPNLGTLKSLSSKKSNPALQTNNLSASSQNANSIAPNNCRLYVEDSNKQNVTLEIDIIHDQLKIIRPRNTKFLPFRSIKDVNFINNSSSKLIELKFVERSKQVFKILDDANYTLWFSLIKFKI
ncbi:MAG: ARS-binding factor 1 [Marteilia pararefringens]